MPSIAQEEIPFMTSPNPLKRRRDDEVQMKLASPRHTNINPHSHLNAYPHPHSHDEHLRERRQIIPRSRISTTGNLPSTTMNKRMRVEILPPSAQEQEIAAKVRDNSVGVGGGTMDLRACHICRRKPTIRKELDAFADCEGCGKRACWVCVRECLGGWGGGLGMGMRVGGERECERGDGNWVEMGLAHKGMVCSRCCVERGTEGEVLCLGCLRVEEGA